MLNHYGAGVPHALRQTLKPPPVLAHSFSRIAVCEVVRSYVRSAFHQPTHDTIAGRVQNDETAISDVP